MAELAGTTVVKAQAPRGGVLVQGGTNPLAGLSRNQPVSTVMPQAKGTVYPQATGTTFPQAS